MVSQVQRNSQRGVGTACQSRGGSHSQGCHWRKRLESCIETERDKDRRERERRRRDGGVRKRGRTGMRTRRERRRGQERVTGGRDPRTGNREGDKAVRNKVQKQVATKSVSSCAPAAAAAAAAAYRPLLSDDALQHFYSLQLHSRLCLSTLLFQLCCSSQNQSVYLHFRLRNALKAIPSRFHLSGVDCSFSARVSEPLGQTWGCSGSSANSPWLGFPVH